MQLLRPLEIHTIFPLPLFAERVPCGFPSPAQDYIEDRLNLHNLLVSHPSATYFVRASGDSMLDAGIGEGDLLVIDRSLTAQHGDIVMASVNGEFTVKELQTFPMLRLLPRNRHYQPISFQDESELQIFGVVTSIVKMLRHVRPR